MRILPAREAQLPMSIKKLVFLLLIACPLAQAVGPQPSADLPMPPQTLAEAKEQQQLAAELRRDADARRSESEAAFKRDDIACYAKFLVNACREKARLANIERMKVVRQYEIDANLIERRAKSKVLELEDAEKSAPQPTRPPVPTPSGTPRGEAPEGGTPIVPPPLKPAPAAQPGPEAKAKADADKKTRVAEAEKARREREQDAAERAARAKADAARYDQRAREAAEKKAKKAATSAP
ncbi:hypothetical protein [Uliginosibacterium aquaticum]|uniref:Colicin import membrane protein n=1 Tax=Uliginosibacterium aquaticum TaxID=2731212 RepID=A0ABX2IJD0_9RHOO|nr:hypothetical protein [Uliginosibacterium aquaticum]NSL56941.1 hypothetical protein [Uliginosibacterium aquaticum]